MDHSWDIAHTSAVYLKRFTFPFMMSCVLARPATETVWKWVCWVRLAGRSHRSAATMGRGHVKMNRYS